MSKFRIGDRVELLVDKEPYYSGYAGNPKVLIPAGTIGVIGDVDVPGVYSGKTFTCVDFELPNVYHGNSKQNLWRCSCYRGEIRLHKESH